MRWTGLTAFPALAIPMVDLQADLVSSKPPAGSLPHSLPQQESSNGFLSPFMSAITDSATPQENEKTLEIAGKSRVFDSEVDGARTRNLRIDSPVVPTCKGNKNKAKRNPSPTVAPTVAPDEPKTDELTRRLLAIFNAADESQRAAILMVAQTIVRKLDERDATATAKLPKHMTPTNPKRRQ